MRTPCIAALAVLLLLSACDDTAGGTTTTSTPGGTSSTAAETTTTVMETTTTTEAHFVVTSDDGDVTLRVPVSALPTDPGISITVLDPEEYPPELAGALQNPDARIYRMEPAGLAFDAPVRLTRSVDAGNFTDLADEEVPVVVLLQRSPDGTYTPLDGQRVRRHGDRVDVSGELNQLSTLVTVSEQQTMGVIADGASTGYAVAIGDHLRLRPSFRRVDGTTLEPPDATAGTVHSPLGVFVGVSDGSEIRVACTAVGADSVDVAFEVMLLANAPDGQVLLGATPLLVPGAQSLGTMLTVVLAMACHDPG